MHIYTPQEITALLAAARQLAPPKSLRRTFRTLLGLLACTGLRISEALQLQLADWDPTQAVLTIRQTKFGQSRYVPLSPSAADRLERLFAGSRQSLSQGQRRGALSSISKAKPLAYRQAGETFAALRQQLGWQDRQPRPRLHDLRHTFAVECLLGWYRQGQEELNAKILSLAVYLGHRNIRHTYWYLSAVPELLRPGQRALGQGAGLPERSGP